MLAFYSVHASASFTHYFMLGAAVQLYFSKNYFNQPFAWLWLTISTPWWIAYRNIDSYIFFY